jgi:RNA polymerase sigma-70 factor (ECF subfamily)
MDVDLLERLRAGDRAAQEALWRDKRGLLRAVCARHAGDAASADDMAAEVFYRFVTDGAARLRDPAKVDAYLASTAVRMCRREVRKQRRLIEYRDDVPHRDAPAPPDAAEAADTRRRLARLAPCLARLTDRRRRVVDLKYGRDETQRAIADALGVTEQAVSKLVKAALLALQRCMQEAA